MISGPIPMRVVAAFLGKDEREMPALIRRNGLPAVNIHAATRPVAKIYFGPLLAWVNHHATGFVMSAEDLEAELERCRRKLSNKARLRASAAALSAP